MSWHAFAKIDIFLLCRYNRGCGSRRIAGDGTEVICLSGIRSLMELVLSGLTLLDLVSQQREAFPHESDPTTTKRESG